jgi:hypothetical protein
MMKASRPQLQSSAWTLVAFLVLTSTSRAEFVVTANGSADWQGVSQLGNGGEYWDNASYDGNNMNVGYFLTKTGGFAGSAESPDIDLNNLQYFGRNQANDAPTNLKFGDGTTTTNMTTILIEVAGFANVNELYYKDSSGQEKQIIFHGEDGSGTTTTFTAIGEFELILKRDWNGTQWDFEADSATSQASQQYFSVFRSVTDTDTIYVGMEDLRKKNQNSDLDYNDMVISLTKVNPPVNPTPEPSTACLALCGIAGLGVTGLRRFRRRSPPPCKNDPVSPDLLAR